MDLPSAQIETLLKQLDDWTMELHAAAASATEQVESQYLNDVAKQLQSACVDFRGSIDASDRQFQEDVENAKSNIAIARQNAKDAEETAKAVAAEQADADAILEKEREQLDAEMFAEAAARSAPLAPMGPQERRKLRDVLLQRFGLLSGKRAKREERLDWYDWLFGDVPDELFAGEAPLDVEEARLRVYAHRLRVIAYLLRNREAIWWGCQLCTDGMGPAKLAADQVARVEAAARWVVEPGAAHPLSKAAYQPDSPGDALAMAVHLATADATANQLSLPGSETVQSMVVRSILATAKLLASPAKAIEYLEHALATGREIAGGKGLWSKEQAGAAGSQKAPSKGSSWDSWLDSSPGV